MPESSTFNLCVRRGSLRDHRTLTLARDFTNAKNNKARIAAGLVLYGTGLIDSVPFDSGTFGRPTEDRATAKVGGDLGKVDSDPCFPMVA